MTACVLQIAASPAVSWQRGAIVADARFDCVGGHAGSGCCLAHIGVRRLKCMLLPTCKPRQNDILATLNSFACFWQGWTSKSQVLSGSTVVAESHACHPCLLETPAASRSRAGGRHAAQRTVLMLLRWRRLARADHARPTHARRLGDQPQARVLVQYVPHVDLVLDCAHRAGCQMSRAMVFAQHDKR